MAKYIDADLLRKEIERRIADNTFGAKLELIDILAWLDTLSEEPNKSLEEAAEEYKQGEIDTNVDYYDETGEPLCFMEALKDAFIAGAEWQYQKDRGKFAQIKAKTWCEGYDACKDKMMKDAVEGKVFMSFAPGHNQMVMADVDLPTNTKVKIIIVKEEE